MEKLTVLHQAIKVKSFAFSALARPNKIDGCIICPLKTYRTPFASHFIYKVPILKVIENELLIVRRFRDEPEVIKLKAKLHTVNI